MAFELRDYQQETVAEVRSLLRGGSKSIVIQAPTGSGKTVLVAYMLARAAEKGNTSVFNVHRRELVQQSMRTFSESEIYYGVIAGGMDHLIDSVAPVQIASVQTLARRLKHLPAPRIMVWDECHHIAAKSWARIREAFPDTVHIGLTATPLRLDGAGLKKWFGDLVRGPSVEWLIENGHLSDYRLFAPGGGIDTEGLHTRMGDYVKSELIEKVDRPTITGNAVKHYLKHCRGKRAVAFCCSVEHSEHIAAAFRQAGVTAQHVDGETKSQERDLAVDRFTRGQTLVLSNVELFGEGFDLPAIEAAILLRPTRSLAMFLQQCGRSLRPSPGKKMATILDHAGNCVQHGLPDDDRHWSLDGLNEQPDKGTECPVRICPKCYAALPPQRKICNQCGHQFEAQPRKVDEVDGELEQIDQQARAERRARGRENHEAKTREQLVKLGESREYTNPEGWADHVLEGREKSRQRRALRYGAILHG